MGKTFEVQPPYCGSPPQPGALWDRWNLDPILIAILFAVLALYGFGVRRCGATGRAPSVWRQSAFLAGWTIATGALISPLCPLSVALFGARVAQHMILSLVAAPLVLMGRPGQVLAAIWPGSAQRLARSPLLAVLRGPAASAFIFTLTLWFWHAPGPYDATFANPVVYWLMHLTVFGSALLVWNVLLDDAPSRAVSAMAVGAVSTLQMTLLGAIITLTPRLLYAPHVLTPYDWGLTQASDQQLGGLIMWVPGCTIFLAVTLFQLGRAMRDRSPTDALA